MGVLILGLVARIKTARTRDRRLDPILPFLRRSGRANSFLRACGKRRRENIPSDLFELIAHQLFQLRACFGRHQNGDSGSVFNETLGRGLFTFCEALWTSSHVR